MNHCISIVQAYILESIERCSGVKSEFVSNTEKCRINLKKAKKKASKDKRED
ncbi:MAG: hypothetical protein ACREV6_01965 [Clostridium sp.]|uniref:hypothetical protein n=1 Tax=Clostridium sp. TaxID=1506 RepID=UPI003D6D4F82